MPIALSKSALRCCAAASLAGALALTGCGVTGTDLATDLSGAAVAGRNIKGNVHGGVYPIQGATITLMQTQTGAVTISGTATNSTYGSAAKSLLTATSDKNGNFGFADSGWTCAPNEFLYIVVTSGTTTNLTAGLKNNNVVQVGVVGPCSELANTNTGVVDSAEVDDVNVFVSELSTVAAAYALGNFMTVVDTADGKGDQVVNIGAPANNSTTAGCTSGSTMKCTAAGLSHAFSNAANVVYSLDTTGAFPTGQARGSNPSSSVSAVPAAIINTIGDILQQCVDSNGVSTSTASVFTASSNCSGLFSAATPPNGTAPTNTLQVAMDMAKYPTNNISGLFNQLPTNPPFTPVLDQAPTSSSVSIFYGATANGSFVPYPVDLALDASDAVYVLYGQSAQGTPGSTSTTGTNNTSSGVFALNANGSQLFAGVPNTSLLYPAQIAISSAGRVYVTDNDPVTTANAGLYATPNDGTGKLTQLLTQPNVFGIALDRRNDIWLSLASATGPSIYEYPATLAVTTSGTTTTPATLASATTNSKAFLASMAGLAVDYNQNIWGVTSGSSTANASAVVVPNAGTLNAPTYGTAGSNGVVKALATDNGFSVAFNSTSTAYLPLNTQLNSATYSASAITALGNPTLSTTKPVSATNAAVTPDRSEVDGAGNVFWTDNEYSGLLYMYTPLSNGNAGSLISLLPCFPYPTSGGLQCITTINSSSNYTPTNLRGMAIDSAGDVWYAADAFYGTVIETLGLASPTWPQLSYGYPGCKPGVTIATTATAGKTPPTPITTPVCP